MNYYVLYVVLRFTFLYEWILYANLKIMIYILYMIINLNTYISSYESKFDIIYNALFQTEWYFQWVTDSECSKTAGWWLSKWAVSRTMNSTPAWLRLVRGWRAHSTSTSGSWVGSFIKSFIISFMDCLRIYKVP